MMYYLLEDPTMFIVLGIILEAVLGTLLIRTGRGYLVGIMIGVLVVALTGIIGQRFIITERKQVVQTLDGVVSALEANDINRLMTYLSPEAQETLNRARWALNQIEVRGASYSRLDIQIDRHTSPPTATASFNGLINYRDRRGEIPYEYYANQFRLDLRKINNRWLIVGHAELGRNVP